MKNKLIKETELSTKPKHNIINRRKTSLCNCDVCYKRETTHNYNLHIYKANAAKKNRYLDYNNCGAIEISFAELLKYLVSSSKSTKGVPILVPETIVFKNKKVKDFYKYNQFSSELKLVKGPYSYPRIIRVVVSGQRSRYWCKERKKVFPLVIIRLKNGYKLLTETEFTEYMLERSSSDQWNHVQYIQSYILDKDGLPSPFAYDYKSFLASYDPKKIPVFDTDENLKKSSNSLEYARKLCTVLGLYLLKVHNVELISAKVTFMKDNKNNFWLSFASEILIRKDVYSLIPRPNKFELMSKKFDSAKFLDANVLNLSKANEIAKAMSKNFKDMKESVGLKDFGITASDQFKVDKVFSVLRPRSVYKLSEMISPHFNPKELIKQKLKEGVEVSKTDQELAELVKPEEVKSTYLYTPYSSNEIIRKAKETKKRPNTRSLRMSRYRRGMIDQLKDNSQDTCRHSKVRVSTAACKTRMSSLKRLF